MSLLWCLQAVFPLYWNFSFRAIIKVILLRPDTLSNLIKLSRSEIMFKDSGHFWRDFFASVLCLYYIVFYQDLIKIGVVLLLQLLLYMSLGDVTVWV